MPTFVTMSGLVGIGAASIPVIIHILNRRRFQRVRWAAMEFLLTAEKVTRRRVRLEHLLLLLIRTLVVLLIAWALAWPILKKGAWLASITGGDGRNVIVLLDDSYSMGYKDANGETAFERAMKSLTGPEGLFEDLRSRDRLTVIRTSDAYRWSIRAQEGLAKKKGEERKEKKQSEGAESAPDPYVFIDYKEITVNNKDALRAELNQLTKPSPIHTDFMEVFRLLKSKTPLEDTPKKRNREIIVLSDFRRFGWTVRSAPGRGMRVSRSDNKAFDDLLKEFTQAPEERHQASIHLVNVGKEAKRNISIERVALDAKNYPVTDAPITVTVDLLNRGDKSEDRVQVTCRVTQDDMGLQSGGGMSAGDRYAWTETRKVDLKKGGGFDPTATDGKDANKPNRIRFTFGPIEKAGPYTVEVRVQDSLEADSRYRFPLNLREGIRVLMINGETTGPKSRDRETFTLRYALFPDATGEKGTGVQKDVFRRFDDPRKTVSVKEDGPKGSHVIDNISLVGRDDVDPFEEYDIVVFANVDIAESDARSMGKLKQFVRNGGAVIFFLGKQINEADYNSLLYEKGKGILPVRIGAAKGDAKDEKKYWELDLDARDHQMFNMPGKGHFLSLLKKATFIPRIRRRFNLDLAKKPAPGITDTVLFRERRPGGPPGGPAVVMREFENAGISIMFSFTADAEWSDFLAGGHKMRVSMPFMHWLIRYVALRQSPRDLWPGQAIVKRFDPKRMNKDEAKFKPPGSGFDAGYSDGGKYLKQSDKKKDAKKDSKVTFEYPDTFTTGRYLVKNPGNLSKPAEVFAVNPFLPESDMTPVTAEEWQATLPSVAFDPVTNGVIVGRSENDIWKWLLGIALGLLVIESLLAAVISRSGRTNG